MATNIMAMYNDSDSDSDNEFFTNNGRLALTRNSRIEYRQKMLEPDVPAELEYTNERGRFNLGHLDLSDDDSVGSVFNTNRKLKASTDADSVDSEYDFEPYMKGRVILATDEDIEDFLDGNADYPDTFANTGMSLAEAYENRTSGKNLRTHPELVAGESEGEGGLEGVRTETHARELQEEGVTKRKTGEATRLLKSKAEAKAQVHGVLQAVRASRGRGAKTAVVKQAIEEASVSAPPQASSAPPQARSAPPQVNLAPVHAEEEGVPPALVIQEITGADTAVEEAEAIAELPDAEVTTKQAVKLVKAVNALKARFRGKELLADIRALRAEESKFPAPQKRALSELEALALKYSKPKTAGPRLQVKGAKANVGMSKKALTELMHMAKLVEKFDKFLGVVEANEAKITGPIRKLQNAVRAKKARFVKAVEGPVRTLQNKYRVGKAKAVVETARKEAEIKESKAEVTAQRRAMKAESRALVEAHNALEEADREGDEDFEEERGPPIAEGAPLFAFGPVEEVKSGKTGRYTKMKYQGVIITPKKMTLELMQEALAKAESAPASDDKDRAIAKIKKVIREKKKSEGGGGPPVPASGGGGGGRGRSKSVGPRAGGGGGGK